MPSGNSPAAKPPRQTSPTTVQRARICVLENEASLVFISAAIVATIIAEVEGEPSMTIASDVPVFWIPQAALIRVNGKADWESAIKRLGFDLLSIPRTAWTEECLLATIRRTYPEAELPATKSPD